MATRSELPQTLTPDEAKALMGRCNLAAPTGLRDRCILALMHRAGLRVSEVCGLHLRDVDWKGGTLRIRAEIAKGGKAAVQPLDPHTLELLERWKPVRRRYAAGSPWLFVTLRGGPVSRHRVWEMTERRARRAGIDHPVWPHLLRHTFATDLLRDGFNLVEVQRLMRHSDVRTTTGYLHIHDADLFRKVRER
jgi:integrase/recombinase XerD